LKHALISKELNLYVDSFGPAARDVMIEADLGRCGMMCEIRTGFIACTIKERRSYKFKAR
jgi:hypothetical protein